MLEMAVQVGLEGIYMQCINDCLRKAVHNTDPLAEVVSLYLSDTAIATISCHASSLYFPHQFSTWQAVGRQLRPNKQVTKIITSWRQMVTMLLLGTNNTVVLLQKKPSGF